MFDIDDSMSLLYTLTEDSQVSDVKPEQNPLRSAHFTERLLVQFVPISSSQYLVCCWCYRRV